MTNERTTRVADDVREIKMEEIMRLRDSGEIEDAVAARDLLVAKFEKYVRYVAARRFSTFVARHSEDLYQSGIVGLMKALPGYDGSSAFTTYSLNFIVHEMSDYARCAQNMSTPHFAKLQRDLSKARAQIEAEGVRADAKAIAERMGTPEWIVRREMKVAAIGEQVWLDDTTNRELQIAETRGASVEDAVADVDACERIMKDVSRMDAVRRDIFVSHVLREETYAEIGERVGMEAAAVKAEYRRIVTELRRVHAPETLVRRDRGGRREAK